MKNSILGHFNIVFIGAGRVAWHLAQAFHAQGHKIVQVLATSMKSAQALASKVGAEAITHPSQVTPLAHFYIYAIPDDLIPTLAVKIKVDSGIHIHTSGTTPIKVMAQAKTNYGCLYPLHSFSKEKRVDFHKVPFFIEANGLSNLSMVNDLARSLSTKVYPLDSLHRESLHLAAVLCSNFPTMLFIEAQKILEQNNIPFDVMHNLITETINNVKKLGPENAITGPAVRGDIKTINKHVSMLSSDAQLQEIYSSLTELIRAKSEELKNKNEAI